MIIDHSLYISAKALPILRWAGGKGRLFSKIVDILPSKIQAYYEPFLGGGALFFGLQPDGNKSVLSDKNYDLINLYNLVATDPESLIKSISSLKYSEKEYYRIRDSNPRDALARGVRFLYLNRTCWNGLYRVNRAGRFNVPIGKFTSGPRICQPERIRQASIALQGARLRCCDFEEVLTNAVEGDFVYFDPPYTAKHNNNGFRSYNEKVFSWGDQERLARLARTLREKGINIMISNAMHNEVLELYNGFFCTHVERTSIISGKISNRGKVSEIIITSYLPEKASETHMIRSGET